MRQPYTLIVSGPALEVEIPSISVSQFMRERMRRWPDRVAIVDATDRTQFTFNEIDTLVGRVAAGLAGIGLKPGDSLMMAAPNCAQWPIVALGALGAGGVISGANPLYSTSELSHQMRDAKVRFVFTIAALLPKVQEACAHAPDCRIIVLGAVATQQDGVLNFDDLVACQDKEPHPSIDPESLAALPYSSGTSGLSKGVMLSHRSIVSDVLQYIQGTGLPSPESGTEVMLAISPMFHIRGFTCTMLAGLANGRKLVTLPRFEPESFLQAIETHRVNRMSVSPPLVQFLALHPMVDNFDLSSIRSISCGAAPLSLPLELKVCERLKCKLVQGFGMTEASGVIALNHLDRVRPGSCGQLLPATQARVVDPETGTDQGRGSTGEIWFRGPQALTGYLGNPAATSQLITADGWIRTGDLGYFDVDGYLFVTDRLKELIKVKGFQVPPAELEALLFKHPGVADCAVIGRADERAGELPVAYVVARSKVTATELLAWVAQYVVEYKRLADVVLCDSIPKSSTGKILRRVLREQDAKRVSQG